MCPGGHENQQLASSFITKSEIVCLHIQAHGAHSLAFHHPAQNFAADFHVYAVEWDTTEIRFYLDTNNYATVKKADWPSTGTWPFDHPFFILLNFAVGGNWPGSPDATTRSIEAACIAVTFAS